MLHLLSTLTLQLLAVLTISALAGAGLVLFAFLWPKFRGHGGDDEPTGPAPHPDPAPPAPIKPLAGEAQARLHAVQFLMPRFYNNNRHIPEHIHEEILDALDRRFGGWTNLGICRGCSDGQREDMMRLEVAVRDEQLHEIRQYILEIGHRLEQDFVYQRITPGVVEIIDLNAESQRKAA